MADRITSLIPVLFLALLAMPQNAQAGEDDLPSLPSLNGTEAGQLKREIAANLRSGMQHRRLDVPLRFMRYRLQKGEHFFDVVTRLSQDPDTLASLNSLSHPDELQPGAILLVPNARGIFREKNTNSPQPGALPVTILKRQGSGLSSDLSFDFYPGRRFEPRERDFFRGLVFTHPLPGAAQSSGYGWRRDPLHGGRAFHGGIDLAAPEGTKVHAAESGIVLFAGERAGYGKAILLRHDYGYVTLYGHLSKILVRKGEKVDQNRIIGHVGRTGRVTGPHLHFEVLKEGRHRPPVFERRHSMLRFRTITAFAESGQACGSVLPDERV